MVAALQSHQRKPDPTRKAEGKAMLVNRRLNSREKRFCALIAQGWAARKAYQHATGCTKDATADVMAWRWKARPAVDAEIAKQRANLTEDGAATRAEKRHHLARVMRSEETPPQVIVSAVAVDNRMTGDDEPFRKAAGDDLRVQFFVLRIGEADTRGEPVNVTPAPAAPQLPP